VSVSFSCVVFVQCVLMITNDLIVASLLWLFNAFYRHLRNYRNPQTALPRELWRVFNSEWPKLYYARSLLGTRALLHYANSLHVTPRMKRTLSGMSVTHTHTHTHT
jgi:hypothetical protein